jgi:prepilin-type N-terminal cleavage/methylation domain-containing protein
MRRTAQAFTLIEIMVVIAIIAGLVTTVAIVVPKMQETQRQTSCMNNLSQLGQVFLMQNADSRAKAQKYSGVALWLSYRKNASEIKRGDERVLVCPGDPGVTAPETEDDKKKWDNADLENPPNDLCSYAARDFKGHPLQVESKDKEIIGSDRQGNDGKTMHHKGVIICVFAAGDAQKMTREELGLSSDDTHPIVIGPEAESKTLQNVVYKAGKKD